MQIKKIIHVNKEEVKSYGSEGVKIQWFRKPEESSHFMLRRFEIEPKGHIGTHKHPEEHQMYILKGPIVLLDAKNNETIVESDNFVYMDPEQMHGYRNDNDFIVSFICGIPKLEKK